MVPPERAGTPTPWVFKSYASSPRKARRLLTGLWALAMLGLPTSLPRENSSPVLSCEREWQCEARVRSQGIYDEPGVLGIIPCT